MTEAEPDTDRRLAWLAQGDRAGSAYALAVPHRASVGASGARAGRRAGSSLEFQEHREYRPGDDLRHLDWNAFARSDRLVLKLFREEVTPHLDLLLDGSRSMELEGSDKGRAALALAALLARAATNSGYSKKIWWAGDGCAPLPGSAGPVERWRPPVFDGEGELADALARQPPSWGWGGIRILISDLLWGGPPQAVLERLGRGAAASVVVQLLASEEVEPTLEGSLRLRDCETGADRELFIDRRVRRQYREALERHREGWRRAGRRLGVRVVSLVAEELLAGWRLDSLIRDEVLRVA